LQRLVKIAYLANKIRIVSCRVKTSRAVSLGVWVGTGGRYEQQPENGISHFLEHLVFKGTRHRSYRDIKEAVEGKGGSLNGFTSEEITCFLAKTLREHFCAGLEVLLDMAFFPALQGRDVERERGVIGEEIRMYLDLPQHLAYDRLMTMLWPGHPLGRNLAGSLATVQAITAADVRAYQQRWYQPANITIVACGDITAAEIAAAAEKFFAAYRTAAPGSTPGGYTAAPSRPDDGALGVIRSRTQQIQLCLGLHAFSRLDPDRYALVMLHIILGANMSSRLFNEIREERGYAYEIATAVKQFNDTGAFIIHAGLVRDKVEASVGLIGKTLRSVMRCGVSRDELTRAKEYFHGQFLMGLEDTGERMMWIGEQIMTVGKVETEETILAAVDRLRLPDVRRVARRIFSAPGKSLALVGPVPRALEQHLAKKMREGL